MSRPHLYEQKMKDLCAFSSHPKTPRTNFAKYPRTVKAQEASA